MLAAASAAQHSCHRSRPNFSRWQSEAPSVRWKLQRRDGSLALAGTSPAVFAEMNAIPFPWDR